MRACTSSFTPCLGGYAPAEDDELVELWHVLSTIPDPRDPRGVRHAFATGSGRVHDHRPGPQHAHRPRVASTPHALTRRTHRPRVAHAQNTAPSPV